MDIGHNDQLGALAADAELERGDFLVRATEQLHRFLEANRRRIAEIGGLTLIDDEPDYLSIAPDLTFRSRTRFEDPDTGEWVSETEVIETASELVELYNPADVYAAFVEAARAGGSVSGPGDEALDADEVTPDEAVLLTGNEAYAGAADDWAAAQGVTLDADDEDGAARRLYDLALEYQERSQRSEARLLEQFEDAVARLAGRLGDFVIVDDDDERLLLGSDGRFRAEVLPEDGDGTWRGLRDAAELVEFYDPTDVFGDLADALAEAFPGVAPAEEAEVDGAAATDEADDLAGSNGDRP